jgi:hypothetical protein
VSEIRTNSATNYDALVKGYYGGRHHAHRHRHRQPSDYGQPHHGGHHKSTERLLANLYGRDGHAHHHKDDEKPQLGLSFSVDDGETLERVADPSRFEEYVVAASLGEDAFEEYVVVPMSGQASLSESGDQAVDPQSEYVVDVVDPLGGSGDANRFGAATGAGGAAGTTRAEPPRRAPPQQPTPAAGSAEGSPATAAPPATPPDRHPAEPNGSAPDDDFISDMKAILTRQKVYDPVSKKTVDADQLGKQASADPRQGPSGPQPGGSQAIFDKIAQSMQYANTYDLGTVELENRFADFDRMSDLQQKADADKRAGRAQARQEKAAVATATAFDSQDFIQDLDAMHRQRGQGSARRGSDDDPFAFVPPASDDSAGAGWTQAPPSGAGWMQGPPSGGSWTQPPSPGAGWTDGGSGGFAGAGAGSGGPSIQIPSIQMPDIRFPNIQIPGMPGQISAQQAASTSANLRGEFVAGALQTLFAKSADINGYFANLGASDFISWFNQNLAKHGPWANKVIGGGAPVAANFQAIWDNIPQIFGTSQINLLQFASLMSILINEVGAKLAPIAELVGTQGHPGIAYAFDSIPKLKASYNDGGSNWTALRCFNDPDFIAAHGAKALGDKLQKTTDARWSGHVYPQSDYPTSVDPARTGFILEADFYKFRGRGLIQTTWRGAYLNLIRFIQGYGGAQAEILARTTAWAGMAADKAANVSSNDDWDALFMNTNLEIACVAIAQHSSGAGDYLNLSGDVNVLNGKDKGSIWRMGRSISGGTAYADLFRQRVVAICNLLGN